MPVTFGAPFQTQPIGRACARSGMQHPLDRGRYFILKYAGASGLFLQVREGAVGWAPETQIFDRVVTIFSSPQMCFNSVGDLMCVFHGYDLGLANLYVYAYYRSADGTVTQTTPISRAKNVVNGMQEQSVLGLTCRGPVNFLAAWSENDGASNGQLFTAEFNGYTRAWSASTMFASRPPGGGDFDGIVVREHPIDAGLHYACLVRDTGFSVCVWYYNDKQNLWVELEHIPDANNLYYNIDMDLDARYAERVHVVAERRIIATQIDSKINYWQRSITGSWDVTPTILTIGTNLSGSQPSIECDSNGDLYFLWKEWDAAAGHMAVYFKRRLDADNVWEPVVKVANSILNVTNDPNVDPRYPGIIRTPCSNPLITDFCVTWGDEPVLATGEFVYVSCSPIRSVSPESTPDLSILYGLNIIFKDDLLAVSAGATNSWSKWEGAGSRILNAIRFLVLDNYIDDGKLLYLSADTGGAWVNQLKTGNVDIDTPYEMRWEWTTNPPNPETPKVWRMVKIRAVGVVDPITFTWETDGGRATGTFFIYRDGWHQIPLPAQCQGREFGLTASLISANAAPSLHDMQVQGYSKRQTWPRRPISA